MINQTLALVASALLLADVHTTAETIKSGVGKEGNPILAGLNASAPWASRFWALAGLKAACIAVVLYVGFTQDHPAVPYLLGALDAFYAWIVFVNNWPLYLKSRKA